MRLFLSRALFGPVILLLVGFISIIPSDSATPTQQSDAKSSEERLYDIWSKLTDDTAALNGVYTASTDKFNTQNQAAFSDAFSAADSAENAGNITRSARAIVHLYKSMSSTEQASAKNYVLMEIGLQVSELQSAYNMLGVKLNSRTVRAYPGLEDRILTTRADVRQARDLVKSESITGN